jgi:hypothetical protein
LGAAWADTLVHPSVTRDGRPIRYALGISVDRYRGTREWSHSGATGGYRTFLARYPELGRLSIAVLCNSADADPTALTRAIVDSLHPGLAPTPVLDTIVSDGVQGARWAGRWRAQGTNQFMRAAVENGRLRLAGTPVLAARTGGYLLGTGGRRLVEAAVDKAGRPSRALMIGVEQDTTILERVADPVVSAAELASFAGRYRNDEVDATYDVRVEQDRLKVVIRSGLVSTLEPVYRDGFESPELDNVFFTRDAKGRVTALHLANGRMWDLVFARVR